MFGAARLGLFNANPTGGKAYFSGGYVTAASAVTRTYNMSTGVVYISTTTGNGNLPSAAFVGAGFGNQVNGFNVGGYSGSAVVNVSRSITFANDVGSGFTWTNTATTLPGTQRDQRGTSSSAKGYSWAGYRDGTGQITVNFQMVYASGTTWSTGTALPLVGAATGFEALHCNAVQALWIGGCNDAATTSFKQLMTYVFSTDTPTYSQNGAANFAGIMGATGNQDVMVVVSGFQGATFTLGTQVNKYNISNGAATSMTAVPTAYRNSDAAGNDYVGIYAGCFTGAAATPAQTEGAYTYSADTYTLLTAYLTKTNIYTAKTESIVGFSSTQTS